MPTASRWLIRTALLYLAVALGLGLLRAGDSMGLMPEIATGLWLPQLHFLTVGWLTQLIFGVAFWLFPRPTPDEWGATVIWAGYVTLNLGLVLRFVSEPAHLSARVRSWGLLASAGLQWTASLLLVGYFWRRVRTK